LQGEETIRLSENKYLASETTYAYKQFSTQGKFGSVSKVEMD
jgi:hypothetical protein